MSQLFPPLEAPTEAALRASVERFGVLVPVVQDQHGNILDGHHRSRIATELGVDFEVQVRAVRDQEEANAISRTLNADRRHLTPKQLREIGAVLRQEGHSIRSIAQALGTPKSTMGGYVSGVRVRTPDRSTGLDGKSYPTARQKEPKPRSVDPRRPPVAARRVHQAMAALEGPSSFFRSEQIAIAILGATSEELESWERTASEFASALTTFRRALKEARSVAAA